MSGVKKLKALSAALIVLFLMNSCVEFFSTSWGEIFKRDPKNVKVTASNVNDLLDAAKGDPDLSKAILDQINSESPDTLKLAAIKAANQAANISAMALENIGDLLDALDNKDSKAQEKALREVVENIQNDLGSRNLVGISDKINEIFADKVQPFANPSDNPKAALENAGKIAVTVPLANSSSGGPATVTVDINDADTGAGTVTVTAPNGTVTKYDCIVSNDETITLTDKNGNAAGTIGYDIDDDNHALTLTDLDKISGADLPSTPVSSVKDSIPKGEPQFKDGFIDNSVSEADLTLLVMTLIMAKAEKEEKTYGSLDGYLDTWVNKDVNTGKGLDQEEVIIAAILNTMIDRGEDMSELTDMIEDLLGGKK
jgi:hypothetical protein